MKKLFLATLICLTACSPVKTKPVNTYQLENLGQVSTKSNTINKTLMVGFPVASAGFKNSKMLYTKKPFLLQSYAQNEWVAPPAKMLLPLMLETLRNTHRFKAVVAAPFVGEADYRLDTQLLELQQDFLQQPSQVRLVIAAQLVNTDTDKVIASERFAAFEPAPTDNAYGGVLAANRATEKVLAKLATFVRRAT